MGRRKPLSAVILLLTLFVLGCGDGDSSPVVGVQPPPVTPSLATVRLESELLRGVPSEITSFRALGFDATGAALFGPVTVPKEAVVDFTGVPTSVTLFQVQYLIDSRVVGIAQEPVRLAPGETVTLSRLAFEDVTGALTTLLVTPEEATIANGTAQAFAATGLFADGRRLDLSRSVLWKSADPSVAAVDEQGRATALAPGRTTISASLGPATSDAATLTVSAATVVSLSLDPPALSLPLGTSSTVRATATFSDGTTQDVSSLAAWSSEPPAVLEVGVDGTVEATASGEARVRAIFSGFEAEAAVSVTAATLERLEIEAASEVPLGTTEALTAWGFFSDGSTHDLSSTVLWSSSDENAAVVSPNGTLTAVGLGSVSITATAPPVLEGLAVSAQLTVTEPVLQAVEVDPSSLSLPRGHTGALTARAIYSDLSSEDVTALAQWTSEQPGTVEVSDEGLVTGQALGDTVIHATYMGLSDSARISVSQAVLESLILEPEDPAVTVGNTLAMKATGVFSDGSTLDLTSAVTWHSGDESVAQFEEGGRLRATALGTVEISAGLQGISESASVEVVEPGIVWVERDSDVRSEGGDERGWGSRRISALAYGAGTYVAVGSHSYASNVLTVSLDGHNWTRRVTQNGVAEGVAYGNDIFVKVVSHGLPRFRVSTNGSDWSSPPSMPTSVDVKKIRFLNDEFVTVGYGGPSAAYRSSDGLNWTPITGIPSDTNLFDVTYGNGVYVAAGASGGNSLILRSMDGHSWARLEDSELGAFLGVTYGGGLFVAVSNEGEIVTSPDGLDWTLRRAGTDINGLLDEVTYGGGMFVAVGAGGTILTSSDAITWTLRHSGPSRVNTVMYNPELGQFVAGGEGGQIYTSP